MTTAPRTLGIALGTVGLAALGVAFPAKADAAAPVRNVPASIDAKGTKDVTAQLNAFIASVADGSRVVFPAKGVYRVDGTLQVYKKRGLKIEGNGSTIKAVAPGGRDRRHVSIVGGGSITVSKLTVKGSNPYAGMDDRAWSSHMEAQHAFELLGVQGAELTGLNASDVWGDFVYIGRHSEGKTPSRNVTVHDSTFTRNGRQGISVTSAENVEIYRNSISEVRRTTFDLEPNTADRTVRNVSIHDNTIGRGRLNFVSAGGQGAVHGLSVVSNILKGRSMNASLTAGPARRSGVTFVGNRSDATYGNAGGGLISITGTDDIVVKNNTQRLDAGRGMAFVITRDGCRVDVSGNTWAGGREEVRRTAVC